METINDILDFAIKNEEEAYTFYMRMSEQSSNFSMKEVFLEFASEEKSHKERLLIIKEKGSFQIKDKMVAELMPVDSPAFEDLNPAITMNYRQALLIAIQKEQAAYKMYQVLARYASNSFSKSIFNSLAEEELRHKTRFQQEYDNFIINNN
jgi:rubrerythrin